MKKKMLKIINRKLMLHKISFKNMPKKNYASLMRQKFKQISPRF